MLYESVDPVCVVHRFTLVTSESTRDKIAKSRQDVDTHARVKTISVGTADSQKPQICAVIERHQSGRTDVLCVILEQDFALRVTYLSAAS